MALRRSGAWQTATDDRILEYLLRSGPAPTGAVGKEVRRYGNGGAVRDRLFALAHAGLVAPLGNVGERRSWELTTWGICYLQGRLEGQHLHPRRTQYPAVCSTA